MAVSEGSHAGLQDVQLVDNGTKGIVQVQRHCQKEPALHKPGKLARTPRNFREMMAQGHFHVDLRAAQPPDGQGRGPLAGEPLSPSTSNTSTRTPPTTEGDDGDPQRPAASWHSTPRSSVQNAGAAGLPLDFVALSDEPPEQVKVSCLVWRFWQMRKRLAAKKPLRRRPGLVSL